MTTNQSSGLNQFFQRDNIIALRRDIADAAVDLGEST
jgi:hypothetical protein